MSKLKLLILDANVVIHLHEFGIWQKLIAVCDIHLARTVAEDEVEFCVVGGVKQYIDLAEDIAQGRIHVFDVPLADLKMFRDQFDALYIGELDPGEAESLAYLAQSKEPFLIASGDAIVYRILGRLQFSARGISLEEVLQQVGLQRGKLPWSCSKAFRDRHTRQGEMDAIQGIGLKRKPK
jgi:hypothetical protein